MTVRDVTQNFLWSRPKRGRRIGAVIVGGAAMLALAAMSPLAASAQVTFTLSPPSATNFVGQNHTVRAQVTGTCCEDTGCANNDGEEVASCITDADCNDADEVCTLDGVIGDAIGIGVVSDAGTGNTGQFVWTTVATDGTATFTYTSANPGVDTINGCLDLDSSGGTNDEDFGNSFDSLTECIADVGGNEAAGSEQTPSSTVTKTWVAAGVMLSPSTAYNPVNANHTVTAQVTGFCNEIGGGADADGEGTPCTSTAFCQSLDLTQINDDFCDFSKVAGLPIGIGVVGGVNSGPNAPTTWTNVGTDGTATFTYSSSIPGIDTIQGCLDIDGTVGGANDENSGGGDAGDLSMCINDAVTESGVTDVASTQVTKHWFTAPTVTLTPAAAANPTSETGAPSTHTLTTVVSGGDLGTCTSGSNTGAACNTAADCGTGTPVCDYSGFTIEFNVNSGPNAGAPLGTATTDPTGTATKTYTDALDAAGLDTDQSCLDVDVVSGDGGTETAAECISESNSGLDGGDVASNLVYKRWEGVPALQLQNLDLSATLLNIANGIVPPQVYTLLPAYNPVGSMHTVQASISSGSDADLGVCSGTGGNAGSVCDANSDCVGTTTGICDLSGYPIGFLVTSGPNAGTTGWGVSLANGTALFTYPDNGGAGQDMISSCLDTDMGLPGSPNDEVSVAACLADSVAGSVGQGDFASNAVVKNWLARFVTGGGKVINGKAWDTFGGVVGQKPNSATALIGEWQQQAHAAKGGNLNCHWSAFSAFALSCTGGSCGNNPNTVTFTTTGGSAACGNETVKIIDGGKKPDTIQVVATNSSNNVPALSLVSGNFTIHP